MKEIQKNSREIIRIEESEYEGHKFVSAVHKDNIYGLQFHPERSGEMGLMLLNDIIRDISY